jgi:hypothetical protein
MELCPGGDLGKVINKCQKENSTLREEVIWKIFAQIASAIKDCHRHTEGSTTKPILHRDIKPANIFLDSAQNIKIGDFGLAKELSTAKTHTQTNVGTPFYMSPELINGRSYDERSDIWSLGCLLYELASLKPPHHDAKGTKDLVVKINSGRVRRIPAEYSNDLWRTIQELMSVDLSKRPRIEDVMDIKVPLFVKHMQSTNRKVQEFHVSIAMEEKNKEHREKEGEVGRREKDVAARELSVEQKEKELAAREAQLVAKETLLKKMEATLKDKEKYLNAAAVTAANATTAPVPTQVVAVKPCKPAPAVTGAGAFKIYADPPTTGDIDIDMDVHLYDLSRDAPAANTRRRSLTSNGVDGAQRDVSDGVKRAKELLSRNAAVGKENGVMPPAPPTSTACAPTANGVNAPVVGMRKRPLALGVNAANAANIAHQQASSSADESPSKRIRFAGRPLSLKQNDATSTAGTNLLRPPPTFTFVANQHKQNLTVKPASAATAAAMKNQNLNQQQYVREATALL